MMIKAKRVICTVDRDLTEKLSKNVYVHEIPLLEVLYGEESVKVNEGLPVGTSVADLRGVKKDAANRTQFDDDGMPVPLPEIVDLELDAEWDRLFTAWGAHPEYNMPLVEYVYRNKAGLAAQSEVLLKQHAGAMRGKVEDDNVVSAKPAVPPQRPDEPPEETPETEQALGSKESIKAEMDRLGIKYTQRDNKQDLLDKLHTGVLDKLDDLQYNYDPDVSTEQLIALLDNEAKQVSAA